VTWSIKQWRRLAEPQRNKTHWDYLLEEMEWLSKDFREERAWKVALAKKAVKAVTRWHQERAQLESKENRSEETRARRLACAISREVLDVWSQVARVAQYKHEQRLEVRGLPTRGRGWNVEIRTSHLDAWPYEQLRGGVTTTCTQH